MKEFAELIAKHGLTAMLDHIRAVVALVDRDGTLVTWNRAFETYKSAHPSLTSLKDFFVNHDDLEIHLSQDWQTRWFGETIPINEVPSTLCDCLLIPLEDGRFFFVAESMEVDLSTQETIQKLSKQVDVFRVESETAKKIATRKQTEVEGVMAQAYEMSYVDPLTFLPNRRMILRELQDEVLRAERYKTPLSISVIDVDHFKRVNDQYGHMLGDEALRSVAAQLRDHIRHPDIAGRYGGEEFLVLLPNSAAQAATEQAARLCKLIRDTVVKVKEQEIQVTISIGIAEFQNGVDTWDTLLSRADTAMYEAKKRGRDRWAVAE